MQSKWRKERNRLSIDTTEGICIAQCSLKNVPGEDFFAYVCGVPALLQPLRSVLVPRLEILQFCK
jgi:hypothetical protein